MHDIIIELMTAKKTGRPQKYTGPRPGAPTLSVRLEPDLLEWVKAHPGGARVLLQRLIRAEMARERRKGRASRREA